MHALISEVSGLSWELFLQVGQMHVDGGSSRFAEHASEWNPTLGLGIFPDREPPRTWTREDFEQLEPGKTLRPTSHKVFHLGVTGQVRNKAWQTMFGRGTTLSVFLGEPAGKFLERTRTLFLPAIPEKVFRRYPFFLPLFDRRLLENTREEQLAPWSCGLSAFVRESAEDRSVLVVSRVPLKDALVNAALLK